MIMLKIGATDYTHYVQKKSYGIKSNKIYEDLVDANHTTHRQPFRRKIKGSLDLVFFTQTEYNSFLTAMSGVTSGEVSTISVYVGGDINSLVQIDAYCTIDTVEYKDISADYSYNRLRMNVEQV